VKFEHIFQLREPAAKAGNELQKVGTTTNAESKHLPRTQSAACLCTFATPADLRESLENNQSTMVRDAAQSSQIRANDFLCLYDISWTLHRLQWPSLSNRPYSLLSNSRNRANRAKQLLDFLHIDATGEEADNTFDEKVGAIRECSWGLLEAADREEDVIVVDGEGRRVTEELGSGIVINLTYDTATYRVILYGPTPSQSSNPAASNQQASTLPLLLTKTPIPLTKRLFTFLLDTFDIRITPVKLPQSVLHSTLESYIEILYRYTTSMSLARRSAFLASALKDIKITLSFNGPITPHLRTIDTDIPADTVCNLVEASVSSKTSFMQVLAVHLEHHTGIQLPLHADGDGGSRDLEQLIRISKIVCHAFALSGDGRFKIVEKARSAAEVEKLGSVIREANEMVLASLLSEAVKAPG
jgi:Kinetochore complex Sim4 subunit Fta1